MPSEIAVLLDPLAVAVRAVELAQTCPGALEEAISISSKVVITGAGPVGILAALVVRLMGVEQIVLVGDRDKRIAVGPPEKNNPDCSVSAKQS